MKNKNRHTPGPWRVLEDKRYGPYPSSNVHYYDWIIDSGTRKLMAVLSVPALSKPISQHSAPTIKEYRQTLSEVKANAQLIAAAPDLLAALEAALMGTPFDESWRAKAVHALAKAKGEKS